MLFPQGALARPAHPLRLALARAVAPALALVGEFEADACARPPALFECTHVLLTRYLGYSGYSRAPARPPFLSTHVLLKRYLGYSGYSRAPVRPPSLCTHTVPSGAQAVPVRKPGQSTQGYSPREPSSGRARAGAAGCITSAYLRRRCYP
jgi:hypothetical protein